MTLTAPATNLSTAALEERVRRGIEVEDATQAETIAHAQLLFAAAEESGFRGDLRRAIHSSGMHVQKLANATGIDVIPLCDFLEGTAELTSDQIQKLVDTLKLQLVRTIPPAGTKAK
jgi:hypothetical protein